MCPTRADWKRPTPPSSSTTWRRPRRTGRAPTGETSSSSASSTRRRDADDRARSSRRSDQQGFGWLCVRSSAPPSTFELQAAANDDAFCCHSDAAQLPLDSAPKLLRSDTARVVSNRRCSPRPCSPHGGAGTEPLPGRPALPGGKEEPVPHPAHGIRRHDGGRLPRPGRLPGERGAGPVQIPTTSSYADPARLPARGHGRRRSGRDAAATRGRGRPGPLRGIDRAVGVCHEILNGKPYTFLDDAPLEERRSRAVQMRRGCPAGGGVGRTRSRRVARVRTEAAPDIRGPRSCTISFSLSSSFPSGRLPTWFEASPTPVGPTPSPRRPGRAELWSRGTTEDRSRLSSPMPPSSPTINLPPPLPAPGVTDADGPPIPCGDISM